MTKATQKYQTNPFKEERRTFSTANIESNLHHKIAQEAALNKFSLSAQIQSYIDHNIKLQEQVDELRAEIKKITDVN